MPYDDFLPDEELPTSFTVSPPPEESARSLAPPSPPVAPVPPMPPTPPAPPTPPMPPKHGFRPPVGNGACRIDGIVIDRWGLPREGATVRLYSTYDPKDPIAHTRSDRMGRFHFSRLRPGRYRVAAAFRHRRGESSLRLTPKDCRREHIVIRLG